MPYQSKFGRPQNLHIGPSAGYRGSGPSISERALDGIPGCLAWLALVFSIIAAFAFPRTLLLIAALLGFYSAVRFLFAGIANVMGLRKIKRWEATNWRDRHRVESTAESLTWESVQHVVIIPNYKEPIEILRRTLDNLAAKRLAKTQMNIILAMEAADSDCTSKAEQLLTEYEGRFHTLYFAVHPRGLPGEMQCKSANQAWAARWIKRKLVDQLGYNIDHIVVTTMDADTLWHEDYFEALTYLFATNPDRHLRFWQAPIRYHTNIWDINPLLRIVNAYSTAFELAYLAAPWWIPMPMSSYSLSLRLLDSSGYWDGDVIADEWHMFIKAYFVREGQVKLDRIFLPFSATAVTGDTLWQAIVNRYQQTLRHAWGSKEVGYIVARMIERPDVDFNTSFKLLFRVAHDILLAGAGWVILTAGSQLPFLMHPGLLGQVLNEGLNNPVYVLLQISFLLVTILGIVFWFQDVIVRPPRTHKQTLMERVWTLLSFPLLPILTLVFVAIPVMQAQTRLLIGIPLRFKVSRKT